MFEEKEEPDEMGHSISQIRHSTKIFSERVRRDKILNAMIAKIREGKTPGSVLCGVVPAPECALPHIIHIDDMMKNPDGRVGYPITLTGIQHSIRPKRHVLDYASIPNSSPGTRV